MVIELERADPVRPRFHPFEGLIAAREGEVGCAKLVINQRRKRSRAHDCVTRRIFGLFTRSAPPEGP